MQIWKLWLWIQRLSSAEQTEAAAAAATGRGRRWLQQQLQQPNGQSVRPVQQLRRLLRRGLLWWWQQCGSRLVGQLRGSPAASSNHILFILTVVQFAGWQYGRTSPCMLNLLASEGSLVAFFQMNSLKKNTAVKRELVWYKTWRRQTLRKRTVLGEPSFNCLWIKINYFNI